MMKSKSKARAEIRARAIFDVDMDHFDCSKDSLATTGVNTCICFVIILDTDQHVFIEHRSDPYFPSVITSENVPLCLKNVAEHVHAMKPKSNIT